jgi:hypothetical protein
MQTATVSSQSAGNLNSPPEVLETMQPGQAKDRCRYAALTSLDIYTTHVARAAHPAGR